VLNRQHRTWTKLDILVVRALLGAVSISTKPISDSFHLVLE